MSWKCHSAGGIGNGLDFLASPGRRSNRGMATPINLADLPRPATDRVAECAQAAAGTNGLRDRREIEGGVHTEIRVVLDTERCAVWTRPR